MSDIQRAKSLFSSDRVSLALCRGCRDITAVGHGISPLLDLVVSGRDLTGCSAADKIVGCAAAFLFIRAGVSEVWGEVMSRGAEQLLLAHGIRVSYGTLTDAINNRSGDGICPMEAAVANISDPDEATAALLTRRNALRAQTRN